MGRTYEYDTKMVLSDGAAAYTASSIGQVASANAILKVGTTGDVRTDISYTGGGTNVSRSDFACVVNVSAITTATDGQYRLWIMGSNNSDGSKPVTLAGMEWGLGTLIPNGTGTNSQTDILGTGSTSTTGRREIFFSTEQNGVNYLYVYMYLEVIGSTSHSVTLTAFIAKLPLE